MKKEMSYIGLVLIVFLVLSLLNMPYGFYNLIRFVVSIYFAVLSYSFYKQDKKKETIITLVVALLFQPFLPIHLGRILWNIVDILVILLLIIIWRMTKDSK
ncbi:DUF6804 family protein [Falsiporphyromonas endometrii]|uniref:DUF6804 family protein n=1 Tax=Falsiporphyromonas endometrii TaxID=1387297 RepID=A0ABV9K554_9PORP